MLKEERQALILRETNLHNKVSLADLSEKFTVSEDTVRRDLQDLANAGKIVKVRGGALSKSYTAYSYHEQDIYARAEKIVIAQKAVQLLQDGMLVIISGGSTNLEIARLVPPDLKATFLTISLTTAMQLLEHPTSETIFLGGQLSKSAKVTVGGEVIAKLQEVRPDLYFMGTNGIDAAAGITDSDWEVVTVKKAMVQAAHRVALCTISEKLNSVQKLKVCDFDQLDMLITELEPTNEVLLPYQSKGVRIL
jgi:DeoR/GlpR family transcriptional regulator of sugar metabolism